VRHKAAVAVGMREPGRNVVGVVLIRVPSLAGEGAAPKRRIHLRYRRASSRDVPAVERPEMHTPPNQFNCLAGHVTSMSRRPRSRTRSKQRPAGRPDGRLFRRHRLGFFRLGEEADVWRAQTYFWADPLSVRHVFKGQHISVTSANRVECARVSCGEQQTDAATGDYDDVDHTPEVRRGGFCSWARVDSIAVRTRQGR